MNGAIIIGYHRVVPSLEDDPFGRAMQVSTSTFEQQLAAIQNRFSILRLNDLVTRLVNDEEIDGLAAITLDDGYVDNYLHALPILRRMGVPATVFLATNFTENKRQFWTDRLASCVSKASGTILDLPPELGSRIDLTIPGHTRSAYYDLRAKLSVLENSRREYALNLLNHQVATDCRPMLWDEVRNMQEQGVDFGAHTCGHASLVALPDRILREEIEGSRDLIAKRLGRKPKIFAYPFGDVDRRVSNAVSAAGFEGAVLARAGMCNHRTHRLLLPRFFAAESSIPEFSRRIDAIRSNKRVFSEGRLDYDDDWQRLDL